MHVANARSCSRDYRTPAETNGAKAMGGERDLGTLEPGKLADLVILNADPLLDVNNLSRIDRVVKDGHVFHEAQLLRAIATAS